MAPRYSHLSILGLCLLPHVSGAALQFKWTARNTTELVAPSCDRATVVNWLVFSASLDEFIAVRNTPSNHTCLTVVDWRSDGCTDAPETILGVSFHNACLRHDFGYGRFRSLCMLDEDMRMRVDQNFENDMENECQKQDGIHRILCKPFKEAYYRSVRLAGRLYSAECDDA